MSERAGIVGAYAVVGKLPGEPSLSFHARVVDGALADAGMGPGEVDGILTLGSFSDKYLMHAIALTEFLGLRNVVHADMVAVGGASAVAALQRARLLVEHGVCRNVLVCAADDQLSGMTRDLAIRAMFENRHPLYEAPYGPTTAAAYAVAANRYLHEYGVEEGMLAHATVQSRAYASRCESAMVGKPHTVEDVNASRMIADPLRIFHCAPIADGGGAVVVSGRASPGGRLPVRIRGAGERHTSAHLAYNDDLVRSPADDAAAAAFRDAGVDASALDVALVYDAFASSVGMTLEDLGLAERGRAFHAFRDGEFAEDGRLPVNPNGGLLSGGHPGYPGGMLHVVEAVRQLRGEADVQIAGAELALVHGSGGILTAHAVAVLEGAS